MTLIERHRAVLPNWLALYYADPLEIVSGHGRRVTDANGRTYLDFFAGILTNAIGYAIPGAIFFLIAAIRLGRAAKGN